MNFQINKRNRIKKISLLLVFVFNFSFLPQASAQVASSTDTIIDTGNANVQVVTDNDVNQNNTVIEAEIVDPVETPDTSSSTIEALDSSNETPQVASTSVQNNNTASTSNAISGQSTSGSNEVATSSYDSYINTGDVSLGVLLDNNINSNNTVVECVDCKNATTSIDVNNMNQASTTNDIDINGSSGENAIASSSDDAQITTGDLGIVNIIINFINKNVFGQGKEFFVNIWNTVSSSVDLSGFNEGDSIEETGGVCEVDNCLVTINNTNTGEIINDIVINADTGSNDITNTGAESVISTGDIDIVNDVLNIANLNISGNEWFFAVVNIFGELQGDIILPPQDQATSTEESVVEQIENKGTKSSEVVITNANESNVLNDIDIQAETGANHIASSSSAIIDTGNASVQAKAFNMINYNLSGDSWKFAKVNIFGNWQGFIDGLPAGYSYHEDGDEVMIYSEILENPELNEQFALLMIDNKNIATTTNDITINANTGNNNILHSSGGGVISTGAINIYNSLLNFINNNFSGNNWEFSMINVFGDWEGNLSFGQADLWISEGFQPNQAVRQGDYITYTFLYGNRGDLKASDVVVTDYINIDLVEPVSGFEERVDQQVIWRLGDIQPRSSGSFSYTVQVSGNRDDLLENRVEIRGAENDRNWDDNIAYGSLELFGSSASSNSGGIASVSGGGGPNNKYPSLKIVKSNDSEGKAFIGDLVNYQISITNTGQANAYDVLVLDVMSGEKLNQEIQREMWDLGTLYAGEEVLIEYSIEISGATPEGVYNNEVIAEGWDGTRVQFIHAIASSRLDVIHEYRSSRYDGPNIDLGVEFDSEEYNSGDKVEGRVVITNNGQYQVKNIDVFQDLSSVLTNYSESGNITKKWSLDWLNPGQIEILEFSFLLADQINREAGEILVSSAKNDSGVDVMKEIVVPVKIVEVLGVSQDFSSLPQAQGENDDKSELIISKEKEIALPEDKEELFISSDEDNGSSELGGFLSITRPEEARAETVSVSDQKALYSQKDIKKNQPFHISYILLLILLLVLLIIFILSFDYYREKRSTS